MSNQEMDKKKNGFRWNNLLLFLVNIMVISNWLLGTMVITDLVFGKQC